MNLTFKSGLLAIVVLLCSGRMASHSLAQQQTAVDVLVEGPAIALLFNNIEQFNERLTATISKAWSPIPADYLGSIYYYILDSVDIDQAIDRQGIGGVMVIDNFSSIGWMYPIKDLQPIAGEFGVDQRRLENGQAFAQGTTLMAMRQEFLLMSRDLLAPRNDVNDPDPIDNPLAEREPIGAQLGFEDREMFGESDAVIMLGRGDSSTFWSDRLTRFFSPRVLSGLGGLTDPADRETWERLQAAGSEVRFALGAVSLTDGLHLQTKAFFEDTPDDVSRKLIQEIRGGDGYSSLDFLPAERMLLALAAKGDGSQNATIAKSFIRLILESASSGDEILLADDRQLFYDEFEKIWKHLTGIRMGLYRNAGEIGGGGELALVIVCDVRDSQTLIRSLPPVFDVANRGIDRMAARGSIPPIKLEYHANAGTIEELSFDELQIDTTQIDIQAAMRFAQFFGSAANRIRVVAVDGHLVLFVGTNPDLLQKTIVNIRSGNRGLAEHPAIVAGCQRLDPRHKIQLHVSANNLKHIYSASIRKRADLGKYEEPVELTSLGLVIEESRFGFDLWMPDSELNRGVTLYWRMSRR